MLPAGGWNYGNTTVLGNMLRAHVQPTGLALAELAGESSAVPRVEVSIRYLNEHIGPDTATASLSYALIGLAGQGQRPADADCWLTAACGRTLSRDNSPMKLALLALAALEEGCPWFRTGQMRGTKP